MESIVRRENVTTTNHELLYYLGGDDHIGGRDFDEISWRKYMDEAKKRGAVIWKFGDIIGAIAPGDPRYTARCLHGDLNHDYFADAVVDYVAELYRPYADCLGGLGWGNHEAMWLKIHKSDLIDRVIADLHKTRDRSLPPIAHLRYCGVITTRFVRNKRTKAHYQKYLIAYHHGTSTNAPVTEGIIAAKRLKDNIEGVDLIAIGHVHKAWSLRNERFYVDGHDEIKVKDVRLVCVGSHQQSYTDPGEKNLSWAEQKGFPPAPYGGAFLLLHSHKRHGITARIEQ